VGESGARLCQPCVQWRVTQAGGMVIGRFRTSGLWYCDPTPVLTLLCGSGWFTV
jgi:hypothetical protein